MTFCLLQHSYTPNVCVQLTTFVCNEDGKDVKALVELIDDLRCNNAEQEDCLLQAASRNRFLEGQNSCVNSCSKWYGC